MAYQSVDKIQTVIADGVFGHTKDPKKAAGRALGTLVEIITYYLFKAWGMNNLISIERKLEEYGNPEITHNVEYSLHPIINMSVVTFEKSVVKKFTANNILKYLKNTGYDLSKFTPDKSNQLLSGEILRNACTIAFTEYSYLMCSVESETETVMNLHIYEQHRKPFAIAECKRVGVQEGMNKGPQTIEKAKQGAYVARTVSSLQKVRGEDGKMNGIIYKSDGTFVVKPIVDALDEIISSSDKELLRRFILTIGIVSNHGNWFTSENHNKELKVLAQSYDWLLFLTDPGLSKFIEDLLLEPVEGLRVIREIFLRSYAYDKKQNEFTKVKINKKADRILQQYFNENIIAISDWFNVISPKGKSLPALQAELEELKNKNWIEILA